MTAADHHVDAVAREYWKAGGQDILRAQEVLNQAMATPPASAKVLARAVTIARRADAEGFAPQIEDQLEQPLMRARQLLGLIDLLSDDRIEPNAVVFDHLSNWLLEEQLFGVDAETVGQARIGAGNRPQAARAALEALGWDRLDGDLARELEVSLDASEREAASYQARALLVTPDRDAGLVLGVNVLAGTQEGVVAVDEVDLEMNKQGAIALAPFTTEQHGVRWSLEWPLRYGGESIGLALRLAALVSFKGLRPDPLLAATGSLADDGHVGWVAGVPAKLRAAYEAGMRRVLLSSANKPEAEAAGITEDLQLLYVEHVDEIEKRLNEVTVANELSFDGRLRQARASLPLYGLSLKKEKTTAHSRQLILTDAAGRAILEIWRTGKVRASGPAGATKNQTERLISDVFIGEAPEEREPHKFMLSDEWRRTRLRESLEHDGAEAQPVNGSSELFRYKMRRKSSDAQVTMWTTGRGYLTGAAPAYDEVLDLVTAASEGLANVQSEPQIRQRGPAGGNDPNEVPTEGPWLGTDESGKGDYFGPLVSAAVYADEQTAESLRELGVQDSKKLSDKRVRELAPLVRKTVGEARYKVTPINPARYNALHAEFKSEGKNLNSLLAWGHARSIEDLLKGGLQPRYAIVDQFADAKYIQQRLMSEARNSELQVFQFPKAEADVAVAAASILARVEFLTWLERTSAKLGVILPKGASPSVIEVAKQIVAARGREALTELAKLHFKTTQTVLG